MPEIEDMSFPPGCPPEDIVGRGEDALERTEEHGRIEVPLNRAVAADALPRFVEGRAPVGPDHVAARLSQFTENRARADAEMNGTAERPSATKVGRLFWPFFSDYHPYRPGLYTAFLFNTYEGPGIEDPELTVLKLDYDNDSNPALLIRTVLDELAQVSGDYYLGKAFLKVRRGYKLAAFFALRRYDQ